MASFTWQEIIDRARTYCDDDHDDQKSWITPARWLDLANAEYAQLYKRWVRAGLIQPAITQAYLTGNTTVLSGVLALVGVAKDYGDFVMRLQPAQPEIGRDAFWRGSTEPTNPSVRWAATGVGDIVTVELDPRPSDSTGTNYLVRYVPTVAKATDASSSVELPFGADERLVLGMARRAHLKDSGASSLLNGLIIDADAELNFTAAGKVGGMKVKNNKRFPPVSTPRGLVWPGFREWLYF